MKNLTRFLVFLPVLLCNMTVAMAQSDSAYAQPFRPQYHFSARQNWLNDPNGLVFFEGEYHLFFQYNPSGIRWGNMSWGHAVSRDLVHWHELPLALPVDANGTMMFSGSCVIDKANTSGFGQPGGPAPMVAVYTAHRQNNQSQAIAYSLDKGRTWKKYDQNPVIDLKKKDFRDPSVFWHTPSNQWVMAVVLPQEKIVQFYGSTNLKTWAKLGEFTTTETPATIWECPALVEVWVEGSSQKKWLLLLSMGAGGAAGGSGMQYFVGDFDGKTFLPERKSPIRFVDFGKDYYAAIPFQNTPRAISLGWMNNWQYANDLPTSPFRGAMTLPRELRLVKSATGGHDLRQIPVTQLTQLLTDKFVWQGTGADDLNAQLQTSAIGGNSYRITLEAETDNPFGVRVRRAEALPGEPTPPTARGREETLIGYDPSKQQLYVDRTKSGMVNFSKDFPGRFTAPLKPLAGRVKLDIWVDKSSVEVFANDGLVTMTSQLFARPDSGGLTFFGSGLRNVSAWRIESVWK
jgi:fructan beta-fructosidase